MSLSLQASRPYSCIAASATISSRRRHDRLSGFQHPAMPNCSTRSCASRPVALAHTSRLTWAFQNAPFVHLPDLPLREPEHAQFERNADSKNVSGFSMGLRNRKGDQPPVYVHPPPQPPGPCVLWAAAPDRRADHTPVLHLMARFAASICLDVQISRSSGSTSVNLLGIVQCPVTSQADR